MVTAHALYERHTPGCLPRSMYTFAPYLEPFDREAYIKELCIANSYKAALELDGETNTIATANGGHSTSTQTVTLPTDFRIWIPEWPTRSILWLWPGLNNSAVSFYNGSLVAYNGLTNCLSRIPRIDVIECYDDKAQKGRITASTMVTQKALAIEVWWHSKVQSSWLVVDWHQSKSQLRGTVCSVMPAWCSVCHDVEAHNWTEYLEQQINNIGGFEWD
jgi:hypothetical protein